MLQWRSQGGGQGGHGPPRNICDIVFIVVFLMTHAKFIKQGQVWPPPWKLSSYATAMLNIYLTYTTVIMLLGTFPVCIKMPVFQILLAG